MHVRRASSILLAFVLAVSAALSVGAVDQPRPAGRFPVAPGIVREVHQANTSRGPLAIQLLRFRLDDARVTLTPELGLGRLPGKEPTHRMLRRLGDNAVAGVNGTFRDSYPGPEGQPEGLFIRDRIYFSEPEKKGREWRAGIALFEDGTYEVGKPAFSGVMVQPDGVEVKISAVNRFPAQPRKGFEDETEVVLLTPAFGATSRIPSGTTELVLRPVGKVRPTMDFTARLAGLSTTGNTAIPSDGVVIAASGQLGRRFANLKPGVELTVRLRFSLPDWEQARHAFVAGPLIVRDGKVTPEPDWYDEGFGPYHNTNGHPRTIIGFTADGETLLVTADGRQPGYSTGLTTAEAAELMVRLGAEDAVMLDGGGSTTMAVDGLVWNRPSDAGGPRSVSNSLILRSTVDTPHVTRIGGWDRYGTSAAVARTGWPGGTHTAVIASGDTFADALAGGPLAADRGWPLLLVRSNGVPGATARALADLGVRRVIILGGEAAVGRPVAQDLASKGYTVKRIGGRDRTATAAAIAGYLGPADTVLLTSASNWPDALSATVPASRVDAPVLTTWRNRLSDSVLEALGSLGARRVVVVGGPAAVGDNILRALRSFGYEVERVAGEDRFATSVALARWTVAETGIETDDVAVATGLAYPDALVGGPYAAKLGMLVVLTEPLDIDRANVALRRWLQEQPLERATIIGGRADVSTWVAHQLEAEVTNQQEELALPSLPALPPPGDG